LPIRKNKTVRSLGLRVRASLPDCWRGAHAPTLIPRHTNKRPEALARSAGPQQQWNRGFFEVTAISYLPTTFTTLFVLAAGLLLGYIQ
jgi:hypothetical protein